MAMTRRGMLAAVAAGAAAPAFFPVRAFAQSSDALHFISPYEPGGGTDTLSRILLKRWGEMHGTTGVVENRPGANGSIGSTYVARSNPDGKTLLVVPAGFAANPTMYPDLPFDSTKDLAPVSQLATAPLVLSVNPQVPARTVQELIKLAQAKPGQLNIGSPGVGSLPSMCAGLFNLQAHTKIVEVPYKGAASAINDLLSGQLQCYFVNALQSLPLVQAGKLRALGVTTPRRSAIVPDLPTILEQGVEGFDMSNWYGLLVRGGTPKPVIDKLYQDTVGALKAKGVEKQLAEQAMTVDATSPEEFSAFLKSEMAKYAKILKSTGIKAA